MPVDKKISELDFIAAINLLLTAEIAIAPVGSPKTYKTNLEEIQKLIGGGEKFYMNTSDPLLATGKESDNWLNTSAGSFWKKQGGNWIKKYQFAVGPDGTNVDQSFETLIYAGSKTVAYNPLRPKKKITLTGDIQITNTDTANGSHGIYLLIQANGGNHEAVINGTTIAINPAVGIANATVIGWMYDGNNYHFSTNYVKPSTSGGKYYKEGENVEFGEEAGTLEDPQSIHALLPNIYAKAKPYVRDGLYYYGDIVNDYGFVVLLSCGDTENYNPELPESENNYSSGLPPFNTDFDTLTEAINSYYDETGNTYLPFTILARYAPVVNPDSRLTSGTSENEHYILGAGQTAIIRFSLPMVIRFLTTDILVTINDATAQVIFDTDSINHNAPSLPAWPGHPYTIEYNFIMGSNGKMNLISVSGQSSGGSAFDIAALPFLPSDLEDTDLFAVNRDGVHYKTTGTQLKAYLGSASGGTEPAPDAPGLEINDSTNVATVTPNPLFLNTADYEYEIILS